MSVYRTAVDRTEAAAVKLGHALGRWDVQGSIARTSCTRCGATARVLFWPPIQVLGCAAVEPCKEGNVAVEEPQPTQPPSDGIAKAIPSNVPSFGRQRVAVAVR